MRPPQAIFKESQPFRPRSVLRHPLVWLAMAVTLGIAVFIIWGGRESPETATERADKPAVAARPTPRGRVVETPQAGRPGDEARALIASLRKQDPGGDALGEAVQGAERMLKDGRRADAHLLYLFAARQGHAQAAFTLAEIYDPLHFDKDKSLLGAPDPLQAAKWYRVAAEKGVKRATKRQQALRRWLEERASGGDLDAQRMLLGWR
ncbi:MAG: hypothetical protein ACREWG_08875 [Gammaproteobacteria bacterium]